MSAPLESSSRLLRLRRIIAESNAALPIARREETYSVETHLNAVPIERISALAAELQREDGAGNHDVEAIATQVLLNDYAVAVAHLRAVARAGEQRIGVASATIAEVRRAVSRALKLQKKGRRTSEGA